MKHVLKSLVLVTALASATTFTSSPALADDSAPAIVSQPAATPGADQPDQAGKEQHRRHRFFARLARRLQLTDQQKAQAKELFRSNRDAAQPLIANLRAERHQLRTLIHSGTADEAAIRAEFAKVAAIQADLLVQRGRAANQFMALLTTDQQAKLKEIEAKREQRFERSMKRQEGMFE